LLLLKIKDYFPKVIKKKILFKKKLFSNSSEELVNDLTNVTNPDESNISRKPSRMSSAAGSTADEVKSVKFASPSSAFTKSSSRNKTGSSTLPGLAGGQAEEMNTISTIRTLLQ
jgi:hypothetical protein